MMKIAFTILMLANFAMQAVVALEMMPTQQNPRAEVQGVHGILQPRARARAFFMLAAAFNHLRMRNLPPFFQALSIVFDTNAKITKI